MSDRKLWYVTAGEHGGVVHRFYAAHLVEGQRTDCGIYVPAGWGYWDKRPRQKAWKLCKRCAR